MSTFKPYYFWGSLQAEQVNLEKTFHDSFIYQSKDTGFMVLIIGGLLWTINKLLIDKILGLFKVNLRPTNRLDDLIVRTGLKRMNR